MPAVPVFWLATEDHDFAEVNHVWVFDAANRPVKLEMRRSASAQPVGGGDAGRAAGGGAARRPARPAVRRRSGRLVEETLPPGSTMGEAFGELLRRLLARFDILQVDPMLPAIPRNWRRRRCARRWRRRRS